MQLGRQATCVALLVLAALRPAAAVVVTTQTESHDHPVGADYNPETELVQLSAEACVALVWILMVCCMPLVAIKLEGGSVLTRSQMTIFGVMWVTFLAGIYMFTNVLYFQSVHFDGIRSLTLVETVYLFTQIITTVGYGDIVPAKPRAQVLVAIFVVFNLLILANVIADVSDIVSRHSKVYYEKIRKVAAEKVLIPGFSTSDDDRPKTSKDSAARTQYLRKECPPLEWGKLAKCFMAFVGWCLLGIVFFMYYPGEDRALFEAIYMSVITLSTVGFGVYTPLTEAGKVFGAFWMLFGSATLVAVVGSFSELMDQLRTREKFLRQFTASCEQEEKADTLPERVDLHDFLCFALQQASMVEESKLNAIDETFKQLGPNHQGQVHRETVRDLVLQHQKREPASRPTTTPTQSC